MCNSQAVGSVLVYFVISTLGKCKVGFRICLCCVAVISDSCVPLEGAYLGKDGEISIMCFRLGCGLYPVLSFGVSSLGLRAQRCTGMGQLEMVICRRSLITG